MNLDDTYDLYASIAPAAFAVFGAEPISMGEDDWYEEPGPVSFLTLMFNASKVSLANTVFHRDEGQSFCEPHARATHISVNPYWAAIMDEDEMEVVLLHEIAHAVGPFSDGHGLHWASRGRMLHPVSGHELFVPRRFRDSPYEGLTFPTPPTLSL